MEALTETQYQGRSCLGFPQGETSSESTSPRSEMRGVQDFSSYLRGVTVFKEISWRELCFVLWSPTF